MSLHLKTCSVFIILIIYAKSEIHLSNITVNIQEGWLQGRVRETLDEHNIFYAFQGIPYAEPPLGNLRFEPPVPKRPWNGTLNATIDGNMCVQGAETLVKGSEDCLFLNVYVPQPNTTKSLLPVLVNFHVGRFQHGGSSYDLWGPDSLLDEDVIVVIFNYRLGIFGFLSTGDLVVPGNNGLKDQVLALKWIQNNIKMFGGDPNKVTVYGDGVGAFAVSFHMLSPLSKGLFRGAIMSSGVALCIRSTNRRFKIFNKKFAEKLALDTTNSSLFVSRLKNITAHEIQSNISEDTIINYSIIDPTDNFLFGPVLEPPHQNAFMFNYSYDLLIDGKFNHVPCVIGFTSLEMSLYPKIFLAPDLWSFIFDYDIKRLVPLDLNVTAQQKLDVAGVLKLNYFSNTSITSSEEKFKKFLSHKYVVRPIREYVRLIFKRVPVFYYKFSYEGDLGRVNRTETQPGVANGEDMNYLWRLKYASAPSVQDVIMRQKVVSWWTNFVKYLNPTPQESVKLPQDVQWEQVDDFLSYLDINNKTEMKQFPDKADMELWDSLYSKYGHRKYFIYT